MSFDIDAALAAVLAGDHSPCARLLSLAPDGSIRASWDARFDVTIPVRNRPVMTSGVVAEDRTRLVRGSMTITLANPDAALAPNEPGDYFFTDERLRVERGAIVDGTPFYVTEGTYVVSSYDDDPFSGQLTLTGDDPTILAQQDFGEVVTVPMGMPGADVVRMVLEPVLGSSASWHLDDDGQAVQAVRSFAEDDKRLARLVGLLNNMGLELFADRLGDVVLQPIADPTTLPVAASYDVQRGSARLLTARRSGSWHPVNRVVVIGEAPGRPTVRGQADITDPSSAFHQDRVGLRVAPIFRSAEIVNQAQANAKAQNLLIAYLTGQDAVSISLPPDLRRSAGDIIELDVGGTSGRFWSRVQTLPVVTGAMSIQAPRVVPLFVSNSVATAAAA